MSPLSFFELEQCDEKLADVEHCISGVYVGKYRVGWGSHF